MPLRPSVSRAFSGYRIFGWDNYSPSPRHPLVVLERARDRAQVLRARTFLLEDAARRRRLSTESPPERLAGISARDNNSSGGMTRRHPVSKNAAARLAWLVRLSLMPASEIRPIIATGKGGERSPNRGPRVLVTWDAPLPEASKLYRYHSPRRSSKNIRGKL